MRVFKGTDPETFVVDASNKPVPAHRLGFGDKYNKTAFPGGKAFRDGYAIEINVAPSPQWYVVTQRVQQVVRGIQAALPEGHKLITVPTVKVDLENDFTDAPPDVQIFGCDPSMDAYTGEPKLPDIRAMEHEYRYIGGHLHFSGEGVRKGSKHWSTHPDHVALFIRMLDAHLALPFACWFHRDTMWQRRKYYGQAGEYRQQYYPDGSIGIEYRTLGPEVFNHPALTSLAFGIGEHLFANYHWYKREWDRGVEPYVQHAVNTGENPAQILESFGNFYSPALVNLIAEDLPFMGFRLLETPVLRSGWYGWAKNYLFGG